MQRIELKKRIAADACLPAIANRSPMTTLARQQASRLPVSLPTSNIFIVHCIPSATCSTASRISKQANPSVASPSSSSCQHVRLRSSSAVHPVRNVGNSRSKCFMPFLTPTNRDQNPCHCKVIGPTIGFVVTVGMAVRLP